jgi:hypothetical protein
VLKAIAEKVRPERDHLRRRYSMDSRTSSEWGDPFVPSTPEQTKPGEAASPGTASTLSSSTHYDAAALSYNRITSLASVRMPLHTLSAPKQPVRLGYAFSRAQCSREMRHVMWITPDAGCH